MTPSPTTPRSKNRWRLVFVAALSLAAAGCAGAPDRANDVQNLNGISDDISAVRMTQSELAQDLGSEPGDDLPEELPAAARVILRPSRRHAGRAAVAGA